MGKNLKKPIWAVCVFLVFSSLLLQNVSAGGNGRVPLSGKWEEIHRSASSTIPITAFINDDVLSIHSSTQRSDITICISKEGEVLYEETVPASESSCVMIDLGDFDLGIYSVELRNQWADYLSGIFEIERNLTK